MEGQTKQGAGRWLALVLLGLLLGLVMMAPASGHVTQSTNHVFKHIKRKTDRLYVAKKVIYQKSPFKSVDAGQSGLQTAQCPAGTIAISGGAATDPTDWEMEASTPSFSDPATPSGWTVIMENEDIMTGQFLVYAICAKAQADVPA